MPHIHEKIDFAVDVFIVYKSRVLLRRHDKYKIWLGVGGHIELDEDPIQALHREVREEVGLTIELISPEVYRDFQREGFVELSPPWFLNRHRISQTHEHVSFVYFAIAITDVVTENTAEHSEEIRWFSSEELKAQEDIVPDVRFYAFQAIQAAARFYE